MEEKKDCKDVIVQLSASRTAIDRTIGVVASSNLIEYVRRSDDDQYSDVLLKEAINLIVKSR
jgi:DNA-binding FrmR family transcriptional regulator